MSDDAYRTLADLREEWRSAAEARRYSAPHNKSPTAIDHNLSYERQKREAMRAIMALRPYERSASRIRKLFSVAGVYLVNCSECNRREWVCAQCWDDMLDLAERIH